MQTFNVIIEEVSFSLIRVTYGNGDVWYHISYKSGERLPTFRMKENENNEWEMYDIKEDWLKNFEPELNKSIKEFEISLQVSTETLAQKESSPQV